MEKLRKEIIEKYNELLYSCLLDEDINDFHSYARQKTLMIKVLNSMLANVNTGFYSLDDMIKKEIILLMGKTAGGGYDLAFNFSGYYPVLEQVTFKE